MTKKEKKPIIQPSTTKYIIRGLLGTFSLGFGPDLFKLSYDIIKDLKRSRTSSDEKIEKAYISLQETSKLIGELEESLNERTEKLNFLRKEYKRYSKLAEVGEDKAKALIQQLELSLGKTRNRGYWMGLLISLIAGIIVFIFGILLSPIIRTWLGMGG
ncbi:MAG: hypothetical protein DRH33_06000 [Candidatus Nealsonbacteria bacterium]|nr:MAG: hypothetical protein DRH33_06000 [Candidatus Nealsonbacteria bacterium]